MAIAMGRNLRCLGLMPLLEARIGAIGCAREHCLGYSRQFTSTAHLRDKKDESIGNLVDLSTLDDVEPFLHSDIPRRRRKMPRFRHPRGFMSQVQSFDHVPDESKFLSRTVRVKVDIDHLRAFLYNINAVDVFFIKVPAEKQYSDFIVSMVGKSARHCKSLGEAIVKEFKEHFVDTGKTLTLSGDDNWYCLDMGNVVIHVFSQEERNRLQLEKLWMLGSEHDDQLRVYNVEYDTEVDHFS